MPSKEFKSPRIITSSNSSTSAYVQSSSTSHASSQSIQSDADELTQIPETQFDATPSYQVPDAPKTVSTTKFLRSSAFVQSDEEQEQIGSLSILDNTNVGHTEGQGEKGSTSLAPAAAAEQTPAGAAAAAEPTPAAARTEQMPTATAVAEQTPSAETIRGEKEKSAGQQHENRGEKEKTPTPINEEINPSQVST